MKTSRVLSILICLAICAVFAVLYVERYVVAPKRETPAAEIHSVEAKGEDSTPAAAVKTPEYSVLPRASTTLDDYVTNVTGTEGEENLLDYYAFGGNVFLILGTDTDGGDYRAQSPSLAVARFDGDCTLKDTLTLPQSAGYDYLCAALYDYGLMVAGANGLEVCVWAVSTNLSVRRQVLPYPATSGVMLYASGADVLCLGGDKLYALCLSATLSTLWAYSVGNGDLVPIRLYQTASTYAVICSGGVEGTVYTLSNKGFLSRSALAALDDVTPYAGGYAVLSKAQCKLSLYDATFGLEKQISLPKANYQTLVSYASGLVLLAQDSAGYTGLIACNHGDILSRFTLPAGSMTQDPVWTQDGAMLVAMQQDNLLTVYRYRPFGAAPNLVARVQGANHAKVWTMGGYLYAACDSVFDYGCFAASIGGRDVYLLRTTCETE